MKTLKKENTKEIKKKRRKEKDGDESSLKEFNLSELFNETQITLENVKSEKGSDEDLKINNSCKRSRKLENSHTTENNLITDSQNNAGERKSKKRKEKLKERENELLPQDLYTNLSHSLSNSKESGVSAVNINRENSDSELDNLKSKKSKKRRHSCSESDIPVKKRKRKSA
ncbi:hypothetical protein NQ314_012524 [Rhamnusium bicolor]|uniref:Uncharacterized protein n=1 Tax=Rhamnusium bicolor TaxID=1586634 RepID=A0AAV8XBU7_9CUCU|nr:hypothetical protein NQ314_012524 [Rhamnusium bicolor]